VSLTGLIAGQESEKPNKAGTSKTPKWPWEKDGDTKAPSSWSEIHPEKHGRRSGDSPDSGFQRLMGSFPERIASVLSPKQCAGWIYHLPARRVVVAHAILMFIRIMWPSTPYSPFIVYPEDLAVTGYHTSPIVPCRIIKHFGDVWAIQFISLKRSFRGVSIIKTDSGVKPNHRVNADPAFLIQWRHRWHFNRNTL